MDISLIQQNIMDNDSETKEYYFTLLNGLYVLHIFNPNSESINKKLEDKKFYKILISMLFDKDKKLKKGCFNHEHTDDDYIYNLSSSQLMDRYFKTNYSIILLSNDCEPISYMCISDNTLWTLCTNDSFRNQGYMKNLINHILEIIKNKKINFPNINIDYDELKFYIRHDNPIKEQLLEYYKSFGFKKISTNYIYNILKIVT